MANGPLPRNRYMSSQTIWPNMANGRWKARIWCLQRMAWKLVLKSWRMKTMRIKHKGMRDDACRVKEWRWPTFHTATSSRCGITPLFQITRVNFGTPRRRMRKRTGEYYCSMNVGPWPLMGFKLCDQVETEHRTINFLGREDQEALIPNSSDCFSGQRYHESDEQLMLRFGQSPQFGIWMHRFDTNLGTSGMANVFGDAGYVCRYQLKLTLNTFAAGILHIWLHKPFEIPVNRFDVSNSWSRSTHLSKPQVCFLCYETLTFYLVMFSCQRACHNWSRSRTINHEGIHIAG